MSTRAHQEGNAIAVAAPAFARRAARALAFVLAAGALLASTPAAAGFATVVSLGVPSQYALAGQPVTVSATISSPEVIFLDPPFASLFSGTITFRNYGTVIPGCSAVPFTDINAPRTARCTFTAEADGHGITAEYSGSTNYDPSSTDSNGYLYIFIVPSYPADSPLPFSDGNATTRFGAMVTSTALGLSGFTGTRPIGIVGGQYSVGCTTTFTTAPGTVQAGDILCLRHVTPLAGGELTRTTVTIGAVTSTFDTISDSAYDAGQGQDATIAAAISHTLVLPSPYGSLMGWGDNTGGKLGNGRTASTSVPVQAFGSGLVVAAGLEHSLFVANGQVYAMGLNTEGQLGSTSDQVSCEVTGESGSFPCKTLPRPVAGLANVVGVSAGWRHSLALKSDGSVWAWGSGFWGQNGTNATQQTPVRVNGLPEDIVRISAGYMHSVALASDGTVWAWGNGRYGEMGPNSSADSNPVPVPVAGISDVIDIAAGGGYTLARKADGTVWAWGINVYGQLGDPALGHANGLGVPVSRATPTAIPGLANITQIAAGFSFAFARRVDGTVYSWGLNHRGQANGTAQATPTNCGAANGVSCILSPTPVPGGSTIRYLYAGGAHAVFVDNLYRLRIIGDNSVGQRATRDPNYGATFSQTTFDPDTILNPAGVGGTPANVGRPGTAGGLDLGSLADGLSFGEQPQGVRSPPLVLSLNNLSTTQALMVDAIFAEGDFDPAEFSAENDCPASLPAGGTCFISVYFTPSDQTTRYGRLTILSNATDSDVMQFGLVGVGVDPRAGSSIDLALAGPATVTAGTAVTINATVTSSLPVTGTVTFTRQQCCGTPQVPIAECVDVPLVAGAASCTTSSLPEGGHSLHAYYSGNAAVQPSYFFGNLGITVNPVVVSYTLAVAGVSGAGYGTGTVNSVPAGINNCVGCFTNFPVGTVVTLTATPAAGSVFAGWSGDCTGTGTCTVTMSANRNVSAPFTLAPPAQPTLTVTKAGSGGGTVSSSPAGIACGATCEASFDPAASVTLTATAAAGSVFSGWGGACAGKGACTVAMSAARSVTAYFSLPANVPRLGNISTRMQVLTGDNVLIGGFVIGGTQAKQVVVRAGGPSLTAQGVPGALQDPMLRLFSGQTVIASNDDWGQSADAAAIESSGFKPNDPRESAILATLGPGRYTAIVEVAAGATGVGLIEVFEVDKPEVPLVNIATRGQVLTGDDVMIGGFIISGDAPQTVIVRARGPSLTAQGVQGALQDPVVQLYSGQTVIASNDDWQLAGNAAAIQSSGFAPSNLKEAAILVTLQPGSYTAIVTGAGGTTGVAIIEVFAVLP